MTRKAARRQTASVRRAVSKRDELRVRPSPKKRASAQARHAAARLKFERLARRWRRETAVFSSTIDIAMHPSYQAIIGMGEMAVPLILESLSRRIEHWFWALEAITQDNPTPRRSRGDMGAMACAWLNWGRERGLIAFDAKAAAA